MVRRYLRWMFLIPPLLIGVLWAWSYFERVDIPGVDTLHYPREPKGGEMFIHPSIYKGRIWIRYCRVMPGAPLGGGGSRRWGFGYGKSSDSRFKAGTFVEVGLYAPMWSAMALALVYPSVKAVRFVRGPLRRSRWRRSGRCEQCGYDLTGNVSGVCPECGTAAGKAA